MLKNLFCHKITRLIARLIAIICVCFILFNFISPFRKAIFWLYFNPEYYLAHYPDARSDQFTPLDHYVEHGWRKGRIPNKVFETINPIIYSLKARHAKPLQNPKYYLSVVTIFRDDARFLKEWIEFHRLMGVEHFYLYNHLSTDNYMEILEPYIKQGLVELVQVLDKTQNYKQWNKIQASVYTDTARKAQNETEWLAVLDSDEFLYPTKEKDLKTILKKYEKYASLSVNWKIFGSNDVERIPDYKLLIETLTKSSLDEDLHVKTIVKPRYVDRFPNPHYARLKFGYYQVTENFEYFVGSYSPRYSINNIRINHYWARDLEFFRTHKMARPHTEASLDFMIAANKYRSQHYDASILRFVEPLRQIIFY